MKSTIRAKSENRKNGGVPTFTTHVFTLIHNVLACIIFFISITLQTIGSYRRLSCETKRLFWQDDRRQSLVGRAACLELVL